MHTVPVSNSTMNKLKKLKSELKCTWDELINYLLSIHEKSIIPKATGLSNEMMAVVGSIYIMRNNKSSYMKILGYLLNKDGYMSSIDELRKNIKVDELDKCLEFLQKYKMIFVFDFEDKKYVKLLCYPNETKTPNQVVLNIMFTPDFCRIYCVRVNMCYIYKRIVRNNTLGGRYFVFTPEEYENASIEELIGKCVEACIEG